MLFAVLTTLEALVTVENMRVERVEVTWDPVCIELLAKASFCVYGLGQGGFCVLCIFCCYVDSGGAGFFTFSAMSGTELLLAMYWRLI